MSGMGFGNFSGGGNTGTRNTLLSSSGTSIVRTTPGTFYSYTLPANVLQTNGDYLVIESGLIFSDVVRSGTLQLQMAGLVPFLYDWTADASNEDFWFQAIAARSAATTIQLTVRYVWNYQDFSNYNVIIGSASSAFDCSAAQTISLVASAISGTATSQYFTIASYTSTG